MSEERTAHNAKYNNEDWIGQKFGRLTIVGASKVKLNNGKKYWYWKAVCDCGNNVTVRPADLVKGKIKSCGCYVNELKRKPKKTWRKQDEITQYMVWDESKVQYGQ